MKNNTRIKKFLLMAISVVLVAGISVGLTLAYLTDTTIVKENNFKPAGGITGKVLEPSYTQDVTFQPGDHIHKDPTIDNDTESYPIWTGAKLTFKISVKQQLKSGSDSEYEDVWETVTYSVFQKYAKMTTTAAGTTEAFGTNWASDGADRSGSLFLHYTNSLAANSSAGETNPDNKGHGGTLGTTTTDATNAIFEYVYIEPAIRIEQLESGSYRDTVNPAGPSMSDVYKQFKIKILIDGYGVLNDSGVDTLTSLSAANQTSVINEIKTGLGYAS